MKLTKPKIAMLALLALAAAALLVDRFVLSAPTSAPVAAAASSPTPQHASPLYAAALAAAPATPAAGIAGRLRRAGEGLSMDPTVLKDAFVPAESWLAKPNPGTPAAVPGAPVVDSAERFAREHKLTSVLIDAGGGIAVVNGKVLRVGQEIDGYRLVRLAPGVAEFTGGHDGPSVRLQTVVPVP